MESEVPEERSEMLMKAFDAALEESRAFYPHFRRLLAYVWCLRLIHMCICMDTSAKVGRTCRQGSHISLHFGRERQKSDAMDQNETRILRSDQELMSLC